MVEMEELLMAEEVRDIIRAPSVNAVRIMCSRREIPFVKIGGRLRFRPSEIRDWIEAQCVEVA